MTDPKQEYKPLSEAELVEALQAAKAVSYSYASCWTEAWVLRAIATIRDLQGQVSLRDERLQAIVKAWEEQDVGDYDTWLFAVADEVNTAMRFLEPKEG